MISHTVPKKLLEHFSYFDPLTRSRRLWRYEKDRTPYGRCALKGATSWDGYFSHPHDASKEEEIEVRLKREFEDPVNRFIDQLALRDFTLEPTHIHLLTGYITVLFHRSRARRGASGIQHKRILDAFMALRNDDERLGQLKLRYVANMRQRGYSGTLTRQDIRDALDSTIARNSLLTSEQALYIQSMETMMAFPDERMRLGSWRILRTEGTMPFVIGDAPVVTWVRTEEEAPSYGHGFAQPNVEVLLPLCPTACLHVLPAVPRERGAVTPTAEEVNVAQAAFSTAHCFTNQKSDKIDALLQPHFGTIHLGVNGFVLPELDYTELLFNILVRNLPSSHWNPTLLHPER